MDASFELSLPILTSFWVCISIRSALIVCSSLESKCFVPAPPNLGFGIPELRLTGTEKFQSKSFRLEVEAQTRDQVGKKVPMAAYVLLGHARLLVLSVQLLKITIATNYLI